MSHFPIFHTRAQPHHRILHEILIHFHVSNFSIGASVTDLGQNRRIMCRSNLASYAPLTGTFHFFQYFLWNTGRYFTLQDFTFTFEEVKSSYVKGGKWNPKGPRGGYVRRQIWTTHYTHFKKFCLQKIFWKSLKSLNYWKERCFKRLDFWGSFWKSLCKIVTNNAFLIFFE